MPDHAANRDHGARPPAKAPARPGATEVPLGQFGSVHDGGLWEVTWAPDTGAVQAWQTPSARTPSTTECARLLGSVHTVDYVRDTIDAITRTHGSDRWRSTHGVEELSRWLRMLRAAIDGEAWRWPAPVHEDLRAYYLDYGHTRDLVDPTDLKLAASELWEDLDDLAAQARDIVRDLLESLDDDGTLARAARAAQDLVEVATALHLALNDGYHVAHHRSPGQRPSPR
jgi:hypothetical protein